MYLARSFLICSRNWSNTFVHDHKILQRIMRQQGWPLDPSVKDSKEPVLVLKPRVKQLTRLISDEKYKDLKEKRDEYDRPVPADQVRKPRRILVPKDYRPKYEEFGL
jgi:hypothetical protein